MIFRFSCIRLKNSQAIHFVFILLKKSLRKKSDFFIVEIYSLFFTNTQPEYWVGVLFLSFSFQEIEYQ